MATHEQVAAWIKRLEPLADTVDVKEQCWIEGSLHECGSDWCGDCGRAKARNLRRRERRHKGNVRLVSSGGCTPESDSCSFCKGCGVRLKVSLTDCGIEEEIHHFERSGFNDQCASSAYDMMIVLESSMYFDGDLSARAIAVLSPTDTSTEGE